MAQYSREYIAMLLSSLMYLDIDGVNRNGKDTLGDLIPSQIRDDGSGEYQVLRDALEKDAGGELRNLRVRDFSVNDGVEFANTGACMIENPATGESYVVYRGTQDGEWVDNGIGMAEKYTTQQKNASAYLDYLAEKYGWEEEGKVIVTGHSKGGNKAQFVALDAAHRNVVDEVYSFDGQGFSPEAIEYYRERLGDDYEATLRKIHGVSGENDYVHPLGIQIIPKDQNRYLKQDKKTNILSYHYISNLFQNGDGRYTADPMDGAEGEGTVARTVRRTSEYLMLLNPEDRKDASKSVMQMIETVTGGESIGLNGEEGFSNMIPFWINSAKTSFAVILAALIWEGPVKYVWKQIHSALERLIINFPISLIITANFALPILPVSAAAIYVVEYLYDFVSEKIMTPVISCFIKCYEQFTGFVDGIVDKIRETWTGGRRNYAVYEVQLSALKKQPEYLIGYAKETERLKESLVSMRRQTEGIIKFYPILQYYFRRAEFKLERYGGQMERMGTGLAYICELYEGAENRIAGSYEAI